MAITIRNCDGLVKHSIIFDLVALSVQLVNMSTMRKSAISGASLGSGKAIPNPF